ncbi:MAG TPA: type I methionyl aminopeptidase [Longimicrobiales bacterium]
MITLKTSQEIEAIGRAGAILARLFEAMPAEIRPGVTTGELDQFAERFIRGFPGAKPAFKGLYGFPRSVCISVNDEVVHGIPSEKRVLKEGDLLSFDAGVRLEGWYADAAITYPVGQIDEEARRLLQVTRDAMLHGIAVALPGNRLGDIGHAVQQTAEDAGFSVVRDLVGHGIGRGPHEEPQVPNFGRPGRGNLLEAGMVICIEPMVNEGRAEVRTLSDRWTVVTVDRRRSAHFEHTLAIQADGPKILTALPGLDGAGAAG